MGHIALVLSVNLVIKMHQKFLIVCHLRVNDQRMGMAITFVL